MSIAPATMGEHFVAAADSAGIPLEVLHRVAAMAVALATLPHTAPVITLLAVTGLTHSRPIALHLRDHADKRPPSRW